MATKKKDEELTLFPEAKDSQGHPTGHDDGQLAVDVHETDKEIIVKSAIAGIQPENLDVFVQGDMLTVRGQRHDDEIVREGRALVRECHWGGFSRSLILPTEVDTENVKATLKNGILTIKLAKIGRGRKVMVKEE
ncbi:hypothetical protein A3C96_03525 [Candidatus Uhrbacteria bacterium RIFCSPHIGHO2_02_FULL_60_10]|uniref:SHSP domain-containing protein n=1 Tax=Candidatus Uhrbacteria bacterium RIFCSPHIGHO2_02_FULL_60_10 TaxID=1802392 RepID=A0A1F7U7D9_9BACT|nr:MAG: hypothetical protein A3C96_03525 [Candidatus Uhrbacteria bacterium RIFCSPHIGHO2_02_FULL_60_10]